MKRIKGFMLAAAITTFIFAGTLAVSASPTDLSALKIYAVDSVGTKTEVPFDFKSTVYSYDITIKNDAQTIELDYVTEDSTSQAQILNEQYNLKMDEGINKTEIQVTAADNTTGTYTINTTKLTAQESETFEYGAEPASTTTDDKDAVKVKVGKKTYKISKTIKGDVPKGFEKSSYKYKGKKYECIVKGDASHLVALYLYNSKTEGFFVYNETDDSFYKLQNMNVASRMYTIVKVDDVAKILKNYDKEKITIGEEKVKAWVLDEEEDLYLVYAMNWDEEVNLYCYDAREEVFQRYPISEDSFAQKEAAEVAYTNLQTNRNHLAHKYNWLLKIVGGLIIIIIILAFVIINMKIARKSKKLEDEGDTPDDAESEEVLEDSLEEDVDKKTKKELKKEEKRRKKEEKKQKKLREAEDELLSDEEQSEQELAEKVVDEAEPEISEEVIDEPTSETSEEMADEVNEDVSNETEEIELSPKESKDNDDKKENDEPVDTNDIFNKKDVSDRTYGDEPTFGSEKESSEGFYGGEVAEEDDVLIDITDDEQEGNSMINIIDSSEEIEDDLKETLKAMLPPEDNDDDDDDFEFIDLN